MFDKLKTKYRGIIDFNIKRKRFEYQVNKDYIKYIHDNYRNLKDPDKQLRQVMSEMSDTGYKTNEGNPVIVGKWYWINFGIPPTRMKVKVCVNKKNDYVIKNIDNEQELVLNQYVCNDLTEIE